MVEKATFIVKEWQGKKAENVLISFLTSGFAVFICLSLLVLPNSNNLIDHVLWCKFSLLPLGNLMGSDCLNVFLS